MKAARPETDFDRMCRGQDFLQGEIHCDYCEVSADRSVNSRWLLERACAKHRSAEVEARLREPWRREVSLVAVLENVRNLWR